MSKMTGRVGYQERRENALRPSRYLGYDHDGLGVYFLEREAVALAEKELRRAVWLNPYEPAFKLHLAMCLSKRGQRDETRALAQEVAAAHPADEQAAGLLRLLTGTNTGPEAGASWRS